MSKGQTTSVSIPRFDSRLHLEEPLGLPSVSEEREALIYFSIGLQLGGVDEKDISTWARAYSYAVKNAPGWVWDVLDPEIQAQGVIRKQMSFDELATNANYMVAAVEKLVREGRIKVQVAMPYIAEMKWNGSFPSEGSDILLHEALTRLLDAWNRVQVLGEDKAGTEATQLIEERFRDFYQVWKKHYVSPRIF